MEKIVVIGSSNTDLITKVKKFPAPGETIEGVAFMQAMGGKGANQALAAQRAGGNVSFITCLGNDANGQNALKYYRDEKLNVSASLIIDNVPSGTAMIWVDEKGENCIVITPGANKELSSEYILKVETEIATADMVVLQMEIPYNTVKTVCELAHRQHKKVMLNVAPARRIDAGLMNLIDILVVNETEAEIISGEKINDRGKDGCADTGEKRLFPEERTGILSGAGISRESAGYYCRRRYVLRRFGCRTKSGIQLERSFKIRNCGSSYLCYPNGGTTIYSDRKRNS